MRKNAISYIEALTNKEIAKLECYLLGLIDDDNTLNIIERNLQSIRTAVKKHLNTSTGN